MFTLPDLPYAFDALEPYIDAQTMQIHHDKHHGAYVKNLNDALSGTKQLDNVSIEQLLKTLHDVPESIRTKVRNNGGGHYNHSMFWQIMAPGAGGEPKGVFAEAIKKSFGSFTDFQKQFTASAMGRFGSGWAWVIRKEDGLRIVDTPNQDSPIMEGAIPILGLDVWEHAYYLKYQNMRAEYIKAWWQVVNWPEVEKRFTAPA